MATELRVHPGDRLLAALLLGGGAALIGVAATTAAVIVANSGLKSLVMLVAGAAAVGVAFLSRRPKLLLLFFWVLAFTYNRQFYSFDAALGDYGSQGFYWVPADIFLLILFAIWLFELVVQKRPLVAHGPAVWPWYAPFYVVCLLSALAAMEPVWGATEMLRLTKLALVLFYLRFNLDRAAWWAVVAGLGAAVVAQSSLGAIQVALGANKGLLAAFGIGPEIPRELQIENRARGTMAHPNVLGPYLIMLVPALLALGLAASKALLRQAALAAGLLGLLGIVLTKSRFPVAVSMLQAGLLLLALMKMRALHAGRGLGIAVIALFLTAVAAVPLSDKIIERLTGDFSDSVEFRAEYNQVALAIWADHPLLGAGLNNFLADLGRHSPQLKRINDDLESALRKTSNVRAQAPVHNVYLYILAETGLFGLLAFLFLYFGSFRLGLRAAAGSARPARLVCLGLLIGSAGQAVQQFLDFSLWTDPSLFTFALILGLFATAPDSRIESAR